MELKAQGKYIETSPIERIFTQGEAYADKLIFIVDAVNNGVDVSGCTFVMRTVAIDGSMTETVLEKSVQEEQYTRATYNGNMKDVRVHYYVDHKCAWQNLPLDLSGWHAADGDGNGNRRTIAIECIMSSAYNANDKASEDNCARLAAAMLRQYGLGIECLFTHTHWLNVKDGKTGSVDKLNTMKNAYKNCPAYILPHWTAFKAKVEKYLTNGSEKAENAAEKQQLYRVRKSWDDTKSQEGAYKVLENAKKKRDELGGEYTVYDADGKAVYPAESEEYQVRVSIPNLNIRTGPGIVLHSL